MEKGDFWIKFQWRVWRTDPALRKLSRESRSLWLDVLCDMCEARTYFVKGTSEDLANSLGISAPEFEKFVADLKRTCTGDVRLRNGIVTIVSRRFQREYKERESTRLRVAKLRGHDAGNGDVTPVKRDRVRYKSKSKSKKKSAVDPRVDARTAKTDASQKPAPPTNRGTRIPEPFFLTKTMREYAEVKRPDVDSKLETEKFVNHFRAATGRTATKLDWLATWRNWILNAKTTRSTNGQHGTNQHKSEREKSAERNRNADLAADALDRRAAELEREQSSTPAVHLAGAADGKAVD
jgi:hypothetical protein